MDWTKMKHYAASNHDIAEAVFTDNEYGKVELVCHDRTTKRQVVVMFGKDAVVRAVTIDERMARLEYTLRDQFGLSMILLLGWLTGDVDLRDFQRMEITWTGPR